MFPIFPGPGPGSDLSAEESAAAFVGFVVLPFVAVCAILVAGLADHTEFALLWLPVLLAALSGGVCRVLGVGFGQAVLTVAGCAWWTFVASLCVVVLVSFRLPAF
jgi:hypothetical protein